MGKEINTAANPFFLDNASTTSDGLMSAADKAKLDSLGPSGSTGNFTFVGNTMDLTAPAVMQIGDVTTSAITFDTTTGPYRWQFGGVDTMTLTSANLLQFKAATTTINVATAATDTAGSSITVAAGAAGAASAATGKGGGDLFLNAGNGADGTATRSAGFGGSVSLFGGNAGANNGGGGDFGGTCFIQGGTGSSAIGSSPGSGGGGIFVTGGAGGTAGTSLLGSGGDGGPVTVQAGNGGQAIGAAGPGLGADVLVQGGNGGDGASTAGAFGGAATLRGGGGGAGTVSVAAGTGGDALIQGGFGGTANGGVGGAGGNTAVRGGFGTGGGNGAVTIGDASTSAVGIGAPGVTTTVTGTLSLPQGTSTGQLVSQGNASNFSAQAVFKDSNGNLHFGIDAAGLPSLGSIWEWRENWLWVSGLANSTTSPVPNSQNIWGYTNVTSTGLSGANSNSLAANAAINVNPGTAINSVGFVSTILNVFAPQNLTNLYAVLEFNVYLSQVGANNVSYGMGLANGAIVNSAHPAGYYFFKASTDTNWQAVTDDGVTTTSTNTGVPPVANTAQAFRIEYYGAGSMTGAKRVRFYINNALVATNSTNVYSANPVSLQFGGKVTAAAVVQSITIGPTMFMLNRVATPLNPPV